MAVLPSLDISWQGSHKRKGKPVGFRNLGNTCYLNSVLQCLTYTPPLANLCLRGQHARQCEGNNVACPFCLLEGRISRSLNNDVPLDSPQRIFKYLQNFAKHFRPGRQEDAHELLRYAVDACDNVCIQQQKRRLNGSLPKGELQTVMKEIFGGCLQSQIRCLACNAVSSKVDNVMDLSLDIMHMKSLKEAISKFFQPETLDGNNKYQCEKCRKLATARKQMSVHQAPNVLAIQMKRFENFSGGKIDAHVEFEEKLKLRAYMSKASQDLQPDYSLYAAVVHSGYSQYGGHYYAYVKDPRGQWYCCNDSFVSAVDIQTVLAERVYILFYVREFPRPSLTPIEAGLSSASSTPSPPTTPDPVTLVKPLATNILCPSNGQDTQKISFFINGRKTKLTNVKPKGENQLMLPRVIKTAAGPPPEAPRVAAAVDDVGANGLDVMGAEAEAGPASVSGDHPQAPEVPSEVQVRADVGEANAHPRQLQVQPEAQKRKAADVAEADGQKKRCVSFEARLTEFRETPEFESLTSRLEAEGREHLKSSGWCNDVRDCFRAAARRGCTVTNDAESRERLINSDREKLLQRLPPSMKEHLVQQLQEVYRKQVL